MKHYKPLLLGLLLAYSASLFSQDLQAKVKYQQRKFDDVSYKVAIVESIQLEIDEKVLDFKPDKGNYKLWKCEGGTFPSEASFFQNDEQGVGWEGGTEDGLPIDVFLSPNMN